MKRQRHILCGVLLLVAGCSAIAPVEYGARDAEVFSSHDLAALDEAGANPPAAEVVPRVLTLEQAFALASRAPDLAARRHLIEALGYEVRQADAWPNPGLELEAGNIPLAFDGIDPLETKVVLMQPFELGGKGSARVSLASARADREVLRFQQAVAARRLRVAEAFFDVLFAQENAAQWREALAATQKLYDLALARYEAGKISKREVLPIQVALGEAKLDCENAEAQIAPAKSALAAAVGIDPARFVVDRCEGALDRPATDKLPGTLLQKLPASPAIKLAEQETEIARADLAHERARRWPDLKVGLMYKHAWHDPHDTLGFKFSIPLPIWDSRSSAVAAAEARIRASEETSRETAIELRAEFDAWSEKFSTASRNLAAYDGELLPCAREAYEIALAAFEAGRTSYLETLEPRLTLLRLQRGRLRWALQATKAEQRLRALAGYP